MSLDHTSSAVRRERKARAAKRRQHLAAVAAVAAATARAQPAFNLSPVTPQHSPAVRLRHVAVDSRSPVFRSAPLDTVRLFDMSDISLSSAHSSRASFINTDLESLKRAHAHPYPYHRHDHRADASAVNYQVNFISQSPLPLQLPVASFRHDSQEPARRLRQDSCTQTTVCQDGSRVDRRLLSPNRQHHEQQSACRVDSIDCVSDYTELRWPSSPVRIEEAEQTTIMCRKAPSADCSSFPFNTEAKEFCHGSRHHQVSITPKLEQPLVSVSEDSSPAIILTAFSDAVDPLFTSCNIDAASL